MYLKQKELDLLKEYVWKTINKVDWSDERYFPDDKAQGLPHRVETLLDDLDARQKASSDRTWEYIKAKRQENKDYGKKKK